LQPKVNVPTWNFAYIDRLGNDDHVVSF